MRGDARVVSGAPFEAVGEVRVDASGRARPETFELRRMGGARPVASTERVERTSPARWVRHSHGVGTAAASGRAAAWASRTM